MDPTIINIKKCDKNMDPIIIEIKKSNKNMEEGNDQDVLVCEKCPKTFDSVKSLASHKKKNHSEKKFICSTCGYEVFGNKNYNNHIRKHQDKEKCNKCGKEVVKEYIGKHIVRCKGPKKKRGKEKKHSCDRCY